MISKKLAFWIFIALAALTMILIVIKNWSKIKRYFSSKFKTKQEAVQYLMAINPARNEDVLQSFEEAFLIAWANADKINEVTFEYNGKTYYTSSGKIKQN